MTCLFLAKKMFLMYRDAAVNDADCKVKYTYKAFKHLPHKMYSNNLKGK